MIKKRKISVKNKIRNYGFVNLILNVINPNYFKLISLVPVMWQEHTQLNANQVA
jgi:hypothetical protein